MPISGQAKKKTTLLGQGKLSRPLHSGQHPITFDQYDICAMVKDGSLERLKLSMLQNICQKLELEVPPKPIRRKRIYLDLFEKAVANYTCHEFNG